MDGGGSVTDLGINYTENTLQFITITVDAAGTTITPYLNGTASSGVSITAFQGDITRDSVSLMRPFTISSLCIYLDIGDTTFADYGAKDDFSGVVERIKKIIYEQKFSGAATGLLNSNIIARDLGLKERTESVINTSGDITVITETERKSKIAALLAKGQEKAAES